MHAGLRISRLCIEGWRRKYLWPVTLQRGLFVGMLGAVWMDIIVYMGDVSKAIYLAGHWLSG